MRVPGRPAIQGGEEARHRSTQMSLCHSGAGWRPNTPPIPSQPAVTTGAHGKGGVRSACYLSTLHLRLLRLIVSTCVNTLARGFTFPSGAAHNCCVQSGWKQSWRVEKFCYSQQYGEKGLTVAM
ncbi:hypothetical protein AAFF_G00246390 [Aldrovandia affinis]|uniref:Uncharacterized protein n=1 Tax=Aldrovandia affinis TaxID=143900 RepID=A0AAD7WTF6_9TELE|nr:hypothetical protein AAFF_G00246390 [Aldrovandia affinis]